MKKLLFILASLFILTAGMAGCDKEEGKKGETNPLIGMWEEKAPYHDGICDTIVFNENGIVEKYFEYPVTYSVSGNQIFFYIDGSEIKWPCEFSLDVDTLTIHNFSNIFSIASVIGKDVIFIKIQ
jgi:hypothetical protein